MASKSKQETKNKKIYYRRADWDKTSTKKKTMQVLLSEAHSLRNSVSLRTFSLFSGAEISASDVLEDELFLYLHIVSYVPDEPTSTVQKKSAAKKSKVSILPAPEGQNFLKGDVFVLVKDDHFLICPSGVRESVVEDYLYHLFLACSLNDLASTINLEKVAKTSALKMIANEGVKSIELNTSLYEASVMHINKTKAVTPPSFMKSIADDVVSMFKKDETLKDITHKDNLNVSLSLTFDGNAARSKVNSRDIDFGKAGRRRLAEVASQLINDDDESIDSGFKIVTNQNNTITPDEIRVCDVAKIKVAGKSIDKNDAWLNLKIYHNTLKSTGVLSQ